MKRIIYIQLFLVIFYVVSANAQHIVSEPIQIVRGSSRQSSFITADHDPWIWSTQNTPTLPYPFREGDLGHLVIQPRTSSPRDILFITGDGDDIRLAIKGDGCVGIGTTTPSAKLDVSGAIKLDGGNQAFSITSIDETDAPFGDFINYGGIAINGSDGTNRQMFMFTDGSNTQNVFTIATSQDAGSNWAARFIVQQDGNVGIGTTSPYYKLDVEGTIRAHEIKVNLNSGADFVFNEDYDLMPLNELESFVKTQKHLPEVAPAKEMEAEGLSLSEMNAKLLQKIEELTLYTIEQQREIEDLKKQNEKIQLLEKAIEELKSASKRLSSNNP